MGIRFTPFLLAETALFPVGRILVEFPPVIVCTTPTLAVD